MNPEDAIAPLLRAAAVLKEPVKGVAQQAIKDAYDAIKVHVKRKLEGRPHTSDTGGAAAQPAAEAAHDERRHEAGAVPSPDDAKLHDLLEHLAKVLAKAEHAAKPSLRITGHGHRVQIAGGNIVNTEGRSRRNAITPDERHLSGPQQASLKPLIAQLAERLAGEDGKPDYGAVHERLQRRFGVSSYLLIPRDEFEAAAAYLQQQRAIARPRLRRRNPGAYRQDLFRAIWARAGELGWPRASVYAFAATALGLKQAPLSLGRLGPIQLSHLAEALRRKQGEVRPREGRTTGRG